MLRRVSAPGRMPVVTATGLHKSFGPQVILEDASLSIGEGERVGLVGANGTGKSTLGRILAGLELPDQGTVAQRRGIEIAYLAQVPSFEGAPIARDWVVGGLSVWAAAKDAHGRLTERLARGDGDANALLEEQARHGAEVERLGGWDQLHRVDAVIDRLRIARPDAAVTDLSGGEQRRLALARVLVARPALAILDEPTNHLDIETIEWLEEHLIEEFPGAMLLITHDRYVLDRVVNRTVELDRKKLHAYDGGWQTYLEAKAERLSHEERTESNRQNFLRRELEWLRRQPKARTGKQKARIGRVEAQRDADGPVLRRDVRLELDGAQGSGTVLELRNLSVDAPDHGKPLIRGLDLFINKRDRLGIVGPNGSGKTTLLRTILGDLKPSDGEVVLGRRTKLAYLDQTRAGLDESMSILDAVVGDRRTVTIGGREMDARAYLERFLFDPGKQRQKVAALSGGERARIALARLLIEPANLLILDEPSNDLDVDTLASLESLVLESGCPVLLVTHDRHLLDRLATAILSFDGEGGVLRYEGNYSTYVALRRQHQATVGRKASEITREAASAAPAERAKKGKTSPGLTYGERLELEGLGEQIEAAEGRLAEVEKALEDPTLYAERRDEVPALMQALETARAEVEALYGRWEALELKREEATTA